MHNKAVYTVLLSSPLRMEHVLKRWFYYDACRFMALIRGDHFQHAFSMSTIHGTMYTSQNHALRDVGSRRVTAPARFTLALFRRRGDYSRGDIFRRRLPAGTARLSVGALPMSTTIPRHRCPQTDATEKLWANYT